MLCRMKLLALTAARLMTVRRIDSVKWTTAKRAGVGLAAALTVLGFAAACGGSGGDGQGTPVAANFADCLRQQGIAIPTARASGFPTARPSGFPGGRPSGFPGGGRGTARPSGTPGPGQGQGQGQGQGGFGNFQRPEGVDEQTWQKALQACSSLRPSRFPGATRGPGQGPGGGALAAYLNCLSEHGVTYSPGQTLADDAKVCEVLRPSGTGTP